MRISVTCKLDDIGAYDFLRPIADIEKVTEIKVFRDTAAIPGEKIKYYTPKMHGFSLLGQIEKFFQMLLLVPKDTAISIGIYEIPHGLLAFLVGKLKNIPTVICIIGNPAYRKVRRGLRRFVMYFMLKRADFVTATGRKSREILINNGVDSEKICVLPNPLDVDKFSPSNRGKVYDIINLGRLSDEKELVNFLHIVDIIRQKNPRIKSAIAGRGPEKERLQKTIRELSLEDNVSLLGYVDNTADYYNSGSVFVLTSSTEGLPRTVVEAMACGIPCVVSKVGDVEDLVKDGENGFVINDYSDVEKFAEKIMLLLSDKDQYNSFSEKAVVHTRKNYSRQAATNVWRNILEKVCGAENV
jgi:glycosyltransferase involved in cell wall biosynthesis